MRASSKFAKSGPMIALGLAAIVYALPASAADDPGRYSMTPTDKGFLRLNKQTGAVSLCAKKGDSFACESVADDSAKLQAQNERLAKENEEIKAENKRLEDVLGLGEDKNKRAEAPKKDGGLKLPSEKDIDKAMDEISRLVKKFKDKLKDLGADERGEPL